MIFHCRNCDHFFIIRNSKVRPLTAQEERSIDDGSMIGIPSTYKVGQGIPLPMLNGQRANCRVGDKFFCIPAGDKVVDLLYKAITNGADPANTDIGTLLEMALPESACKVDVCRLRNLVGSTDWKELNEQEHFMVE